MKNLWLKVQQLEIDGLPKSALKIVEEIYVKSDIFPTYTF